MSDPFDRLSAPDIEPDIAAIKGRARRIERRQRVLVSASAAAVAAVALIAVLVNVGPNPLVDRTNRNTTSALRATPSTAPRELAVQDSTAGGEAAGSSTAGAGAATTKDAPAAAEDSSKAAAPPQAATTMAYEPLVAKVSAKGRPIGGAEFTLQVCNSGNESVERDFSDGQRYDFEVRDGDKLIWTWGEGRMFTQALGAEKWKAAECKKWTDTWDGTKTSGGAAPHGTYNVVGILTSSPEVLSPPKNFCSGIC
jgi:hypothetical protein